MLLRKSLLAAVVLFGVFPLYAPSRPPLEALQNELIAADRGIWQAIAGLPSSSDRVEAALAADYIDIDSGVRNPRTEVFKYLHGLTKFSFDYDSARAYVLSSTSGYVIAELTYSSVQSGVAAHGKALTTTVFSKERGHWVAHLHTEMEIKPQAAWQPQAPAAAEAPATPCSRSL
jgi:hypothetical protein